MEPDLIWLKTLSSSSKQVVSIDLSSLLQSERVWRLLELSHGGTDPEKLLWPETPLPLIKGWITSSFYSSLKVFWRATSVHGATGVWRQRGFNFEFVSVTSSRAQVRLRRGRKFGTGEKKKHQRHSSGFGCGTQIEMNCLVFNSTVVWQGW